MNKTSKYLFIAALAAAVTLSGIVVAQNPPVGPAPAGPAAKPASTQATDPNRVVLQVGDEKITAKEFEDFIAELPPQVQAAAQQTGPVKRQIADQLVQVKLMSHEAQKRGLDKTPQFERRMSLIREQLLAQSLQDDEQKSKANTDKLKAYYDAHQSDYETATARHILVRFKDSPVPVAPGKKDLSDAEAKAKADEIRKRVTGGEDFATVAKAESDDTGSGAQGGDLGSFTRDRMVKPFADAAFAMKAGEISQPVKSQFGYHVIQLQDKKVQPFDEVKEQLAEKMGGEGMEGMVDNLKKQSKVVIDDGYFGPAAPKVPLVLPPQ